MKWSEVFSPFKKDGTPNDWGMKFLKAAVQPFATHFGATSFGAAIEAINNVEIMAVVTRSVDKKDPDRMNARLKDVNIL